MKQYDIVLYGATGFTGKRAAAYIKENIPPNTTWAIAGRNAKKLEQIKSELDLTQDILLAEANKKEQVEDLVKKTKVIITTTGPYALYGNNLVASCAKHGVHYVDITGEATWVSDMIKAHGNIAQKSGAKIVSFCGFDSIPADLGVWSLQQFFRQQWNTELTEANGFYTLSGGGLNGGTLLSALNLMESGETKRMADPKLLLNDLPYQDFVPAHQTKWKSKKAPQVDKWVYPFVMGDINTKVVFRSIGLAKAQEKTVADEFLYKEYHAIGGRFSAALAASGMAAFEKLGKFKLMRSFLKKIGPKTNEGPTEEQIENGFFRLKIFGKDEDQNQALMTMQFQGDAGNKATVNFLCQCAFLMLDDEIESNSQAGFLTPTAAFGSRLYDQLTANGLAIKCEVVK